MFLKTLCFRLRVYLTIVAVTCFASAAKAQNGTWNVDASGNWTAAGNWLGGTVPGAGGTATFGDSFGMSTGRTVTIDAPTATLSGMTLDTNLIYTFAGANPVNIDAAGFTMDVLRFNGASASLFGNGHTFNTSIAGTSANFIKNGTGTVNFALANTFTAPITVNAGEIRTAVGDTAFGDLANNITLNGGRIRNSIVAWTTSRNITIGPNGGTFVVFASPATLNGTLSGTGRLTTRVGSLTVSGSGAGFTGAIHNSTGTFTLNNAGELGGTSEFSLAGTLHMDNTAVNNTNRIQDGRAITSRGANISLTGNAAGSTETLGNHIMTTGNSIVTVTSATTASTLTFSGLTRDNRSTVLFRGTSLGSDVAAAVGHIVYTSSPGTLIGGGTSPTTTSTASILPFAYGSTSPTVTSGATMTFVTWDSTTMRIVPLDITNGYTTLAGAGATSNVDVQAATSVLAGGQSINALRIGAFTLSGGAGDVLTLNSGAILTTGIGIIDAPIAFAPGVEGVIHAASSVTVNGVISGNNGLTKSGLNSLNLNGINTYTGVTTLTSGITRIGNDVLVSTNGALGNSSSAIVMTSGSVTAAPQLMGANGVRTVDRDINVITGGSNGVSLGRSLAGDGLIVNGNINISNPSLNESNAFLSLLGGAVIGEAVVLNGVISGNGGLNNSATSYSVINGNNTFTGGFNSLGGIVALGHNNALGTGTFFNSNLATRVEAAGGARTIANALQLGDTTTFQGTDAMTFTGSVFLTGGGPRIVTVNTINGVTFSGNVFGGSLLKNGTGTLVMAGSTSTYTGSTTVRSGTLVIGGNALYGWGVLGTNPNTTLGSAGTVFLADATTVATDNVSLLVNGAHTVARSIQVNGQNSTGITTIGGTNTSGTATYSGQVNLNRASTNFTAAAGGIVNYSGAITESVAAAANFVGGGIQNLSAANTYTGGTTVTGGTLLANNVVGSATGTGNVVVNVGTTLGGAGFIVPGGGNTITINGTVAPGNSAGTLTMGSVGTPTTVTLTGIYAFEMATAGVGGAVFNSGTSSPALPHANHDVLNVFGTLNLTGSTMNLAASAGTGFDSALNYSWLVATTNSGSLNGLPTLGTVGGGDFTGFAASNFSLGNVGGNLYLNFQAIPEPGTLGLLAMGLLLYTSRRRK